MSPLRVGIVGSGFGGTVHAPAYALHPAFEVVAIASPRRAAQVAEERRIPHAFASLDEMLAGVDLDVISVASPPRDHHANVLAALAAGKHVLAEKPFATSVRDAEAMVEAAARAGVATAVAHEFRYTVAHQATRELAVNGHLGPLREIEITAFFDWLRQTSGRPRGWWFTPAAGGGIAGALLSHIVDLASWCAGRTPRAVHGMLRTANVERSDAEGTFVSDVDDGAFAILDYGEGLVARCSADATLTISSATLAIHGERRTVVAAGENMIEKRVYTVAEDEQDELELTPDPHGRYATVHPNIPPFLALLDAFAARIAGESSDAPTFEDALATQRVLAAIGYGSV